MYTHDIRTIWKVIVINVLIVISWTFLVTPHSFRVLITIEQGIAVPIVVRKTMIIIGGPMVIALKVLSETNAINETMVIAFNYQAKRT